ncbi:MAG: creatininase family protein [Alphaproteobacteria bacterium]
MQDVENSWLENLTWPEAAERISNGATLLIPIGAVAKEHGHHLPLKTDYLLARELCNRVATQLPVLIAPVVCFGYYPAFRHYPGSQHLSADSFQILLHEILSGFIDQGAQRLAVVNMGVSTEAPLRIVVRELYEDTGVRVHTADIRTLGRKAEGAMKQKLGGHGDEAETSMILTIAPALVHMDRAVEDYGNALEAPKTVFYQPAVFNSDPDSGADYSATGVRGDPSLATVEKGEAILSAMAEELVAGLRSLFPEDG